MLSDTATPKRLPAALRALEAQFDRPLASLIVDEYGDLEVAQIAEKFAVSEATMRRWMKLLGIERRLVVRHVGDGTGEVSATPEVAEDESPQPTPEAQEPVLTTRAG